MNITKQEWLDRCKTSFKEKRPLIPTDEADQCVISWVDESDGDLINTATPEDIAGEISDACIWYECDYVNVTGNKNDADEFEVNEECGKNW